jgi:hypothetical protein
MAGDSQDRAPAHVLDTESMTIATAAVTGRVVEVFELEAEVLLTAFAQSLEDEVIETLVATAADATTVMTMTGITIVTGTTTATIAADVVTGAKIVDVRIVDTKFTRSMSTSLNLILKVTDRLLFSAGSRLRREGTLEEALQVTAERTDNCMISLEFRFAFCYAFRDDVRQGRLMTTINEPMNTDDTRT